jgi:integrase
MASERLKLGQIKTLMATPGRHCDGANLYLQVIGGSAIWVFRHKERWRSIGPADIIDIHEAREKARQARRAIREGACPFDGLSSRKAKVAGETFGEALERYLAVKAPTWSDSNREKELRRYRGLFRQVPDFTALSVKEIDEPAKAKVLAHWQLIPSSQKIARDCINAVLNYALLNKIKLRREDEVKHHPAMPGRDVPGFFKQLAALGTENAKALQFLILTGARTSEVIGGEAKEPATWREIEIAGEDGLPVWAVGKKRMKARRDHRFPLSSAAVALLGERKADTEPLFRTKGGKNALLNTLRSFEADDCDVHGFRASFETWATEKAGYPKDLVELCTSHDGRTRTQRAYQRSDLLEKRREIVQAWSEYLTGC